MEPNSVEISVKGRAVSVPSLQVGGRTIVVSGKWIKIASVKDEGWLEGEDVNDPEACIKKIKQENLKADIFTFVQKLPNSNQIYKFPMEWENVAAIPTTDYSCWWEQKVSQVVRKNVKRSVKRGVVVREVEFCDQLLKDIIEINNETPVRQGRPYWHYGETLEEAKREYSTLLDRSEFIGAYYENRLIGFIKMVYMGETAGILQILCLNSHADKRPANALIARAVENCYQKNIKYLTYGKYIYGNNYKSPLTEFKRRNGFEKMLLPRYYIPLTYNGKIAVMLGLHHGIKRFVPNCVLYLATQLRSKYYERMLLGNHAALEMSD
jgi:hypothetical protein